MPACPVVCYRVSRRHAHPMPHTNHTRCADSEAKPHAALPGSSNAASTDRVHARTHGPENSSAAKEGDERKMLLMILPTFFQVRAARKRSGCDVVCMARASPLCYNLSLSLSLPPSFLPSSSLSGARALSLSLSLSLSHTHTLTHSLSLSLRQVQCTW